MRLLEQNVGQHRHGQPERLPGRRWTPVVALVAILCVATLVSTEALGEETSTVEEVPCLKVLDETLTSYLARVPYPVFDNDRLMGASFVSGGLRCSRRGDRGELRLLMGTWRISIGDGGQVLGWSRDLAGLWFTDDICKDVDARGRLPFQSEAQPWDSAFKRSVELRVSFPLSPERLPHLWMPESRQALALITTYNQLALQMTDEVVPHCPIGSATVCEDFGALHLHHGLFVRPWEDEIERRERLISALLDRAEEEGRESGVATRNGERNVPEHPPRTTDEAAAHALELLGRWHHRDAHNPWLLVEKALLHDMLDDRASADEVLGRLLTTPPGFPAEEIALAVRVADRRPDVSEALLERALQVLRAYGYRPALELDWSGLSVAVGVPCAVHTPSDNQLMLMAELYALLAPASRNIANRIASLAEHAESETTATSLRALAAEHVTRHHPQGSREAQSISLLRVAGSWGVAFLWVLLLFYLVGLALARGMGFRVRNDDRRLVAATLTVCVLLPLASHLAGRGADTMQADEAARVLFLQQQFGLHPAVVGACAGDGADVYSAWEDWLDLDEAQRNLVHRGAPVLGEDGTGAFPLSAPDRSRLDAPVYREMLEELGPALRQRSGPSVTWRRQSAPDDRLGAALSLRLQRASGHLPMWLAGVFGLFLGLVDALIGLIWRRRGARAAPRSGPALEDSESRPAAAPVSVWTTAPALVGMALLSFVVAWDSWGQATLDRLFRDPHGMTWVHPAYALLDQVWVALLGVAVVVLAVGIALIAVAILRAARIGTGER